MAEATYSLSSASVSLGRGDLQSFLGFSPTGPRRSGAARLGSEQSIYSLVDSFSQTGPRDAVQPRSNDAGPLRGVIPLSLLSVHRDQAPLRLLDYAAI